ncbi:P-loop containing nucleoside triphosphate hydrolase protein [Pelagophyceae sp. CCMP2097]|nr:P-loop containing nucleoside triphosphate hydrolase protein [Pelagophyceae sp. CCMP2097]|mmetsp:Transcript_25057/g.84226  ORF Transcript_25057/g.84226 Transcript_25057/m.84226 type:complete len:670 (+) Transcript_25057:59-2068(+)|eukprot:CAMPEP_0184080582 /NCGR_PEP_ID=MMETSP0974-20121125/2274_1 /TAXON_ID=483370 /ORGANISM="non described non described, Strain CCMP2097" /LENGTH=669 /DNA_ID=CAMNT_0026383249 /DNA_START=60 /DNA_END=2069 /DNA_ORIENTATION=+
MPPQSRSRAVAAAVLLASFEAHALVARINNAPRAAGVKPSVTMSAAPTTRSLALGRAMVATALVASAAPANAAPVGPWALSEFLDAVEKDSVERVTFDDAGRALVAVDSDGGRHRVEILASEGPEILAGLRKHNVQFAVQPPTQDPLDGVGSIVGNLVFPLLFLGGLFLLNRRGGGMGGMGGGGGGGPMGMLNSQSKIQMEPQTGVTFADVAGCDASKLELTEVVEFLKFPEKYTKVGAKTPRGVLLEGPPGTGKTLLARACAGEAGVPFISTSGSEFVEMFVGVGASRIRNLFAEAKKNAPCIIFIDEIDAIGRQRSGGGGFATNDEREQTLNQILTEMDGFGGNTGVIVLAATNRGDVLDTALLRPGRFDRRVPVDLPDKEGRVAILRVHCRNKPLAEEVDLGEIAARTIGFSGASLQNLMNEAAIMAARRGKDTISFSEIDYAIDRLTVGLAKTTGMNNPSRQRLVAYHEAGHALMAALTDGYDTVAKLTIIPRSNGAGGFTLFTPSEDRMESGLYSYRFLKGQLAVALGGRVAEELVFGGDEVTTGASNDLQQVRNIARRMVAQWGFSSGALSATAWEPAEPGGMFSGSTAASEETESTIDTEVAKLVTDAYDVCKKAIAENRALLDAVVEELLEKETIDGIELDALVQKYTGNVLNKRPEVVSA